MAGEPASFDGGCRASTVAAELASFDTADDWLAGPSCQARSDWRLRSCPGGQDLSLHLTLFAVYTIAPDYTSVGHDLGRYIVVYGLR